MTQPENTRPATWREPTPGYRVVTAIACAIAVGALPLAVWINRTQDAPVAAFQWIALVAGIVALDRPAKAWSKAAWVAKVAAAAYLVSGLLFIVL
ncbi:hypothetical protein [Promicromonospora sp. NPDC057488]|uniref:hypothetical protein n=1 Tax=Promicromonospora sp. NPDC057488 TaxID=3346147 RepID=UPI00366C27D8